MTRPHRWTLAALLLALAVSPAAAFDRAAVAVARRDLQAAVDRSDPAPMLALRGRLAALAAADPEAARLPIWIATVAWRAVPLLTVKDPKQAERVCRDALERLEKVLAVDPKNAEALALTGALRGLMTTFQPDAMMTLGPQGMANLARAATLAPDDPRVHLLAGVSVMHKPANFGGGPTPALDEFRRAQQLFATESVADSTAPDWGRDDACLWEGRAHAALGDPAAAVAAYRRALAANPDNGWVKRKLLPEAEAAAAKAKP